MCHCNCCVVRISMEPAIGITLSTIVMCMSKQYQFPEFLLTKVEKRVTVRLKPVTFFDARTKVPVQLIPNPVATGAPLKSVDLIRCRPLPSSLENPHKILYLNSDSSSFVCTRPESSEITSSPRPIKRTPFYKLSEEQLVWSTQEPQHDWMFNPSDGR